MKITIRATFFIVCICTALASQSAVIRYKLSMDKPQEHYFEVELELAVKGDSIDFHLPVWTPGSYLVRDFAKNIESFAASSKNKALIWQKINKSKWRVYTPGAENIKLSYRVYANELSVRTSFLDESHAYINGTSVFMYPKGLKNEPIELSVIPFVGWEKVSTGLQSKRDKKWLFTASNYDEFVDSPIEIGNHITFDFKASGTMHEVAMYGWGNYNVEQLKVDMAKVVDACTEVFGENPNKKYTFIIHNLENGGGGLEHMTSTSLQVNRWTYEGEGYLGFLSLVAHEYFHLWNVKRLHPLQLGPFNYQKENYTDLLWVMEGFTSYYDEYLLLKAGFMNQEQYLSRLAGSINSLMNRPGNKVQPVASASFDAWIKAYQPNENSYNTTISYYTKGAVLAAMVELEILHKTKGEHNLDELMRRLYVKFYKNKQRGFTSEELQSELEELTNSSFEYFFAAHVNGTTPVAYENYFAHVGLDWIDANNGKSFLQLGARTSSSNGKLSVRSVVRGTPAHEAGLNKEDELIAINKHRINSNADIEQLLAHHSEGDTLSLSIVRQGLLQEISVVLNSVQRFNYFAVPSEKSNQSQDMLRKKWLEM